MTRWILPWLRGTKEEPQDTHGEAPKFLTKTEIPYDLAQKGRVWVDQDKFIRLDEAMYWQADQEVTEHVYNELITYRIVLYRTRNKQWFIRRVPVSVKAVGYMNPYGCFLYRWTPCECTEAVRWLDQNGFYDSVEWVVDDEWLQQREG